MNETWTPPNPYTTEYHSALCKWRYEGGPEPQRTDEPCTGTYRATLVKDGPFVPFYYYYEGKDLLCEVGCYSIYEDGELLPNKQTIRQMWEYMTKHPTTAAMHCCYLDNKHWPEELPAIHELTNSPPCDNSAEALEDQINSLEEEARRLLASAPAKTQEECNQASVLVGKLNEWFQYDGDGAWIKNRIRMDAQITPEVIGGHELYTSVGMRIINSVKRCEIFKRVKQEYQKPFLVGLKRAAERVGEKMPTQHAVLGYPATKLSAQKKASMKNFNECLEACKDSDDVKQAVQKWANAYVRKHKKAPPGCEVVEEDIAS